MKNENTNEELSFYYILIPKVSLEDNPDLDLLAESLCLSTAFFTEPYLFLSSRSYGKHDTLVNFEYGLNYITTENISVMGISKFLNNIEATCYVIPELELKDYLGMLRVFNTSLEEYLTNNPQLKFKKQ